MSGESGRSKRSDESRELSPVQGPVELDKSAEAARRRDQLDRSVERRKHPGITLDNYKKFPKRLTSEPTPSTSSVPVELASPVEFVVTSAPDSGVVHTPRSASDNSAPLEVTDLRAVAADLSVIEETPVREDHDIAEDPTPVTVVPLSSVVRTVPSIYITGSSSSRVPTDSSDTASAKTRYHPPLTSLIGKNMAAEEQLTRLVESVASLTHRFDELSRVVGTPAQQQMQTEYIGEGYVNRDGAIHSQLEMHNYVSRSVLKTACTAALRERFTVVAGRESIRKVFTSFLTESISANKRFPSGGMFINIDNPMIEIHIQRIFNAIDYGEKSAEHSENTIARKSVKV